MSKRIALTFDDGPSDKTIKLLEILDGFGIKATFFVVGKNLEKVDFNAVYSNTLAERKIQSPEKVVDNAKNFSDEELAANCNTLKNQLKSGHMIGNHSMTHPWRKDSQGNGLENLVLDDILKELIGCQNAVYKQSAEREYTPRFFRAPEYHSVKTIITKNNSQLGFVKICEAYECNDSDYDDKSYDSSTSAEHIKNKYIEAFKSENDCIVLSHDSPVATNLVKGVGDALNLLTKNSDGSFTYQENGVRYGIEFVRIDEYYGKHNRLAQGDFLLKGQRLSSSNRQFELVFQGDSNVVVYSPNGVAAWNGDAEIYKAIGQHPCQLKIDKIELTSDGILQVIQRNQPYVWKKEVSSFQLADNGKPVVTHINGTVEYV
ncbi:polysaccharide deacetylase [Candidatus Moduliflexus flocculans]|uniref:Polysaccharide deacetylase n=1 Tax=Candidatus Moduliflexus flocculans TaxID=1499966 RepID=A0A081BQQ7_9BACT|nr:polysaccharide deacetylase [Candidatus Moduliflexus flocculans]